MQKRTNRAENRKYHYIYKITREDGFFYIGLHSTDNLEDGYFGSGARLWKSINYHGKDKHRKEILEFLPTREALKLREAEIVNEELLARQECMNLTLGGGGDSHNANTPEKISAKLKEVWSDLDKRKAMGEKVAEWWTDDRKAKQSSLKRKQHEDPKVIKNISVGTKEALSKPAAKLNMSEAKVKNWEDPEYRQKQIAAQNIRKKTEEFSQKQRTAKLADRNPNFGTRWINNVHLRKSTRIMKDEPLPIGWSEGRRISW